MRGLDANTLCLAALCLLPVPLGADPADGRRGRELALLAQYEELRKPGEAKRREALEALKAEAPLPEDFVKRLQQLARAAVRRAEDLAEREQACRLLSERRSDLARARKSALDAVFNLSVYPDEDHGAEGQPRIDTEMAGVMAAYAPGKAVAGDALAPARELVAALEVLEAPDIPPLPDEDALAGRIDEAMFQAGTGSRDLAVMKADRETLAKADPEVAACVEAANRYRLAMGLCALAWNPKLAACAQGHSEDMARRGFHDHKNPDGLGPGDRARKAGYMQHVAENIASGCKTGRAAVTGWIHSSGHHRNLLTKTKRTLGVGLAGNQWTMVLGS